MASTPFSRLKSDIARRSNGATIATVVGLIVAGLGAAATGRLLRRRAAQEAGEHPAPDLSRDTPRPTAQDRAPVDFRPDPTAPVPVGERDALAPATGPSPSIVADRGTLRSEPAAAG